MKHPSFINQVAEFHAAFQYRQPEPLQPDLKDAATNKLRPELLREELRELHEAIQSGNRAEQLDALCDIQYVLSGAVLAWGFRSMIEGSVATIELREIHDMEAHVVAMLGMAAQLEQAANMMFAHLVYTLLREIQSRLTRAVFCLGFSPVFEDAFAAVHENNLAKIWTDDDMRDWQYSENLGENLHFDQSPRGWIARRPDNKIIKPSRHTKVNLSRFI